MVVNYSAPSSVTVGTTSTRVVAENPQRTFLQLVNISDENIFLAFGQKAVLNKGLCLIPNGVFTMVQENLSLLNMTAICTSGSKTLTIQEATKEVNFRL